MQSIGFKFLRALLDDPSGVDQLLKSQVDGRVFSQSELPVFEFVQHHLTEHGQLPKPDTVEHELQVDLPDAIEPATYYLKKMETRHRHNTLKFAVSDARDLLNDKRPTKAMQRLESAMAELTGFEHRRSVVDFKTEGLDVIDQDLKKKMLYGLEAGPRSGWPYLDDMAGAFNPGDYITVVGRPAQGKTYLLISMAMHMWYTQGLTPLVVSMEMHPSIIIQRLAAILTQTPQKLFKTAELGGKAKKNVYDLLETVAASDRPPFYVVDGNLSATPKSLQMLCQQLKPDCCLIDGAYLMEPDGFTGGNDWAKVKSTIESCKKGIAAGLGIPVVGSFQFNKQFKKGDANAQPTMDDIYGSDAIAQISTIILGLMQEDTVETLNRKRVQVLKGRAGETGGFDINWKFEQFPYMDFSQADEAKTDAPLTFV